MTPIWGRVDNDKIPCAHKVPFTTLLSARRAQLTHSPPSIHSAQKQAGRWCVELSVCGEGVAGSRRRQIAACQSDT